MPEELPDPDFLSRLRADLAVEGQNLERPGPSRDLYIFFSFDLVNSTLYKTVNRSRWPRVINSFYEFVEAGMTKRLARASLWKYVGDELLFFLRVRSLADLRDCVSVAHELMQDTVTRLHGRFRDTKTILSIKGCIWCALVDELEPSELKEHDQGDDATEHNMVFTHTAADGSRQKDFLGPDIDIGFRIARHAARTRLVVSADLAYLLYKERTHDDELEKRLKIVAFRQLKGVWGDRHYPVIWYESDWGSVPKSFWYDEHHWHDIVREIVNGSEPAPLSEVVKVLSDLDRRTAADGVWEFVRQLKEGADEEVADLVEARLPSQVELHCAAVAFRDDGRALVAQRKETKRRFPLHWEFGCGQLNFGETFEECLRRNYREDFGADLEFGMNAEPVKSYFIDDQVEGRKIPGIIFWATVKNPDAVVARRHAKVEWVDPKNPDLPPDSLKVDGFDETLLRASHAWKKRRA